MARSGRRRAGSGSARRAAPGEGEAAAAASEADRIIEAALARIAVEGWRSLSLASVAAAAGLPLLRVYRCYSSKQAILCGFLRRIDEAVLTDPPAAEEDERPRDRLFDLLMRRLDALRPYRPALEVLRRDLRTDPVSALVLSRALLRSMRWMLEAADIATDGLRGTIAVKLTCAAYMATLPVWHRDQSPDLGATMAALDARLRRIEGWLAAARRSRAEPPPHPA